MTNKSYRACPNCLRRLETERELRKNQCRICAPQTVHEILDEINMIGKIFDEGIGLKI